MIKSYEAIVFSADELQKILNDKYHISLKMENFLHRCAEYEFIYKGSGLFKIDLCGKYDNLMIVDTDIKDNINLIISCMRAMGFAQNVLFICEDNGIFANQTTAVLSYRDLVNDMEIQYGVNPDDINDILYENTFSCYCIFWMGDYQKEFIADENINSIMNLIVAHITDIGFGNYDNILLDMDG